MKQRQAIMRVFWLLTVLVFAATMSACLGIEQTVAPPPTLSPSATLTLTPTASPTASATPSPTPRPTDTPMPSPTPSPTTVPLRVTMRIEPQTVIQGRTVRIDVSSNHETVVTWRQGEREALFGTQDGFRHVGFVGISPVAEVGPLDLTLIARSKTGQEVVLDTALLVTVGDYAFEHIEFSAETSKLLAPEVTEPELEYLHGVYGGPSAEEMECQGAFDWPWQGLITSEFGTRRQYGDAFRSFHAGLDIDGVDGDPIAAPAAGTVVLAEELQVRGGAVIVDHGLGVMSGFYHLSQIDVVPGDHLDRGDILGLMGSTGLVTGSHLHWELRVNDVPVSPSEWVERDLTAPPEERL